ncbi:unnamed protein product [Orchesella dallaii]|uniref:BTB domain-containing protein n=1 Tax=Orchesella dallaii TaxID=48710 RepID=A0ABP1QK34_9HEXA
MNKNISLVSISNKSVASLSYLVTEYGFLLDLSNDLLIQLDPNFPEGPERQEYLEKLEKAIRVRNAKTDKEKTFALIMETSPTETHLYIHTDFLNTFRDIWDVDLEMRVEGHFTYPDPNTGNSNRMLTAEFSTADKKMKYKDGHAFCIQMKALGEEFNRSVLELENTTVTIQIQLFVEDEGLLNRSNNAGGIGKICKTIQSDKIYSDVSIVANDNSVFQANKCFLAVHSPVLKACMENFEESKTNKIQSAFSGGCVQALLEFVYTLEIQKAIECSKLAVELFQASHYYEMVQLEGMLSEMMLQKGNSWFDVNSAIELFRFVGKIETSSSAKLKSKLAQVLKGKRCELKDSDNFKSMFVEDWNSALEFCLMSLEK